MSESKHTPGPLIVRGRKSKPDDEQFTIDAPDFIVIREVDDQKKRGWMKICAFVDSEDDAHLYAASPDLLAFCLRLHEWAFIYHNRGQSASLESWCEIMVELNEVIAKATGGDES